MGKKALCIPKSIFLTLLDFLQSSTSDETGRMKIQDITNTLYRSMNKDKDKIEYTGKVWIINDRAKLLRNMNMQCTLEDRDFVEDDPTQYQIIPYVTFGCFGSYPGTYIHGEEDWGNYVLKYIRGSKGDENRLKAKHSIGFGGHIEELPEAPGNFHLIKVIFDAACREVEEELGLQITNTIKSVIFDQLIYGPSFIIEDSPVGHVHLGIHINIDLRSICNNLEGREKEVLKEFLDSVPKEGSDASVDKEIDIVTKITRIPLSTMTAFEYNWEGWSQEILHDAMWEQRVDHC